jgi:predicted nucleotide-binding protein (sugar kinase/HSP70/actin superfamily)
LPTRIPDCPANSKTPLAHETITPVVQFTPELDIESIDTLKEQLYAALQAVELREAELAKEVSAANLQEITQLEEKLGKALKQVTAEKEKLLKKK